MKIVRLCIATAAALWTIGVVVGVQSEFGKYSGTRGIATAAAGIGVTAGCIAVTYWLFVWALKKPAAPPEINRST